MQVQFLQIITKCRTFFASPDKNNMAICVNFCKNDSLLYNLPEQGQGAAERLGEEAKKIQKHQTKDVMFFYICPYLIYGMQ